MPNRDNAPPLYPRVLHVRYSPEQEQALRQFAAETGRGHGEITRAALEEYIARHRPAKPLRKARAGRSKEAQG